MGQLDSSKQFKVKVKSATWSSQAYRDFKIMGYSFDREPTCSDGNREYIGSIVHVYATSTSYDSVFGQIVEGAGKGRWITCSTEGDGWQRIKDDDYDLLAEAARRYPVGTRYVTASANQNGTHERYDEYVVPSGAKPYWITRLTHMAMASGFGVVYQNGVWAKVITKKKITNQLQVPCLTCGGNYGGHYSARSIYGEVSCENPDQPGRLFTFSSEYNEMFPELIKLREKAKQTLTPKRTISYKFKVGDKLIAQRSGTGIDLLSLGTEVVVTDIGVYKDGPGYRVEPAIGNSKLGEYGGFIGESGFDKASDSLTRFKPGQRVVIIQGGWGCHPDNEGMIVTIKSYDEYRYTVYEKLPHMSDYDTMSTETFDTVHSDRGREAVIKRERKEREKQDQQHGALRDAMKASIVKGKAFVGDSIGELREEKSKDSLDTQINYIESVGLKLAEPKKRIDF